MKKRAFIETFLLIFIFFALASFSATFFNKEKNRLSEMPYVDEFFLVMGGLSSFFGENTSEEFYLFKPFRDKESEEKEDIIQGSEIRVNKKISERCLDFLKKIIED